MRFKEFLIKQKIQQVTKLLSNVLALPSIPRKQFVKEAKAHEITEKYWTNPNSPLFAFLDKHGIKPPEGIPNYVEGGVGRVYFVDNYAIKFSANRVEANVAQMVKGNDELPTVVIDVQYLSDGIYVILQPIVDTQNVPAEFKQAADYVTVICDEHPELNGFPTDTKKQEQLCYEVLKKHNGNFSLLPYMMSIIGLLLKLYNATGFQHDDASPSNIGLHKGNVIIHDLGPNEKKDFNTLNALSKINKNRSELGLPRHRSF